VARWLEALPTGPSALVIEGEAGIGKTTLWHEALLAARAASCAVLSCRPTEAESALPYAGLSDLFADVPDEVLAELPPPPRRALDVALLRVEDGDPLQRRALAAAVLNILLTWSQSTSMVVAIDDLPWLDQPSVRALHFAMRRIRRGPVGLVVTTRPAGTAVHQLDLSSAVDDAVTRVTVAPLDMGSLDLLLRSHLRTAFLMPVLRRIQETSRGNPFFAIELGRAALDPEVSTSAAEPLAAPSTLTELLGIRLARLPSAVRQVLLAIAGLAHPTVELVAQAAGDVGLKRLGRAVAADVVVLQAGRVRFSHPLLASIVYSQASPEERRLLHRRLAELVDDPDERARHLALGADRPDREVSATVATAGARAARRGAPERAAALMEEAARLTPTGDSVALATRRLDAADYHVAAGETRRARALVEQQLDADEPTSHPRALHRLGTVLLFDGNYTDAEHPLRRAARCVGHDHALRSAIERDLTYVLLQSGRLAPAMAHAEAQLSAAEASHDAVLIAEALDHLCMAKFVCGHGVDSELLDRAIRLDDHVGPAPTLQHPGPGTGRFPLAMTLKWIDQFDAARALMRSLYDEHSEQGDEFGLAMVVFHLGELECWAGNWDAAAQLALHARRLGESTNQGGLVRRALTLDAMVGACCGDPGEARSTALTSLEQCEQARDALGVVRNLKSLGVLELSLERHAEAAEHLQRAVEIEADVGYAPSVLRVVPDAVEALLATDRLEQALPLIDRIAATADDEALPWAAATSARCRGIAHAATSDFARAGELLAEALQEHERLPQPFERARTLLVKGMVERRAKQKRSARDSLEEACRVFDSLGAQRWSVRARREVARTGGRPPAPRALTDGEKRIAELAAAGATNREIATMMFVSEKTVEAHLTHIYRKLGLSSRRELRTWVQTSGEGPEG
jgi:DNA-binding CsgD family transcriptional regulator/tetratricopeptide (TPR) repeat protein